MRKISYEEAKKVIDEYPEQEWYVSNSQMSYSPDVGMNDNSVELCIYWNKCAKIVKAKAEEV